mgnify:CR=1 FL=1
MRPAGRVDSTCARCPVGWLLLAVGCGTAHAVFSAIWATGSDLLLVTVGDVADRVAAMGEWRRMLLLGGIALLKGGVTLGPVLDYRGLLGRGRVRDLVRSGEFVVGAGLLAYGLATMVVSGCRLVVALGTSEPEPATVAASWGHLLIWDPLFVLWGAGTAAYFMRVSRCAGGE